MKKELFIKTVSEKMNAGKCELFVGCGISRGSKFPSWKELLEPLADDIGIKVSDDDDLPMIAQYIVNSNSGNKNCIYQRLEECFAKKKYELNNYHYALADMKVDRVWTTNYDLLLEKCFLSRKPNVIHQSEDLIKNRLNRRMEIIKIHGSMDGRLDDIVLTQHDYDEILYNRTALTQKLEDSFINSSFLFIGYSYRDPDIRNIMITAARKVKSQAPMDHYIILNDLEKKSDETEEAFERRKLLFNLWLKELNRLGIRELIVHSYDELTKVLQEISLKSRGKSVFVSGSHEKESGNIYNEYGKRLAQLKDVVIINGQNQGIGIKVVNGFMETAVCEKKELEDIVRFCPNPYAANPKFSNEKALLKQLKIARESLFSGTQLFVVFGGGMGTRAEYEVAKEKNCIILPAIAEESDYENPLIIDMLEDDYCKQTLEKIPAYKKKLNKQKVPSLDELVNATETLLNA